jgi:hypothetical protein
VPADGTTLRGCDGRGPKRSRLLAIRAASSVRRRPPRGQWSADQVPQGDSTVGPSRSVYGTAAPTTTGAGRETARRSGHSGSAFRVLGSGFRVLFRVPGSGFCWRFRGSPSHLHGRPCRGRAGPPDPPGPLDPPGPPELPGAPGPRGPLISRDMRVPVRGARIDRCRSVRTRGSSSSRRRRRAA